MKIKSNLHAGMTFSECDAQRNYMKQAAQSGNCSALYYYQYAQPYYPSQLPTYPPTYYPPSQPTAGGGYYAGVYYPDRSGACG
jgi:hypothetical protein